ncbi:hypothetical protein [Streptomyces sp. CB03234]|nr:hypothetical protein [Streptomyces sp. CB03234]
MRTESGALLHAVTGRGLPEDGALFVVPSRHVMRRLHAAATP